MTVNSEHLSAFRGNLLEWYDAEARPLPWRQTSDPYRIWISEIMLQQTRVDQAIPYYARFLEAFPDLRSLASADIDDVLRLWEGLGYYSRARNLHRAARRVVDVHEGRFPADPDLLRDLPGVGAYTTAAVASMAFSVPLAAVDGNVSRVVARVFAVEEDIKAGRTQRRVREIAQDLLDPETPGNFNQAMMELGATVCTPKNPTCEVCPLQSVCLARFHGMTEILPFTVPKKPTPHYDIVVGVVRDAQSRILTVQRPREGLLGGLWEFPGGKVANGESLEDACGLRIEEKLGIHVTPGPKLTDFRHQYSHFGITMHAFQCRLVEGSHIRPVHADLRYGWIPAAELRNLAMHKSARRVAEIVAGFEPD